jgi:hypothetical protein
MVLDEDKVSSAPITSGNFNSQVVFLRCDFEKSVKGSIDTFKSGTIDDIIDST